MGGGGGGGGHVSFTVGFVKLESISNCLYTIQLCFLFSHGCIRSSFHPRVTAVARKRPRSFCQKRGGRLQLNTHTPYVCGFA